MANTTKFQTKNGLLTQNIDFVSPTGVSTLHVVMLDNGMLSITGVSGQLFSIVDSLSGTIFGVNDISGMPSIEVDDTGVIRLAQYAGNVLLGTAVDNGTDKLQVAGTISAIGYKSTVATGTAPFTVASTTRVANLNVATAGIADTVTTNANLTGDVTSVGNATTLGNAPVIAKVLTGYTASAGAVTAADSILSAIQKLSGNATPAIAYVSTNTTCVANTHYVITAAGIALTLPTTWNPNDYFGVSEAISSGTYSLAYGSTNLRGVAVGTVTITASGASMRLWYGNSTVGLV